MSRPLIRVLLVACAVLACASSASASTRRMVPVTVNGYDLAGAPEWNSEQYDGLQSSTDRPDLTTLPTIHAVYLYPSDRPSRFARYAAMFQRDARGASNGLAGAIAMAFRWDERSDARGAGLAPLLDITVVKSRSTYAKLSSSRQFGLIADDIQRAGLTNGNKKYFVWSDAGSTNCGQSQNLATATRAASNPANSRTVSVAYRTYDPSTANGGFCSPVTHELTHALGGLIPSMPHYANNGHCNDNGNDIMCAGVSGTTVAFDGTMSFYYDAGNDDYLDPAADPYRDASVDTRQKLGWWTVNLSRFLCPPKVDPGTGAAAADCGAANQPNY